MEKPEVKNMKKSSLKYNILACAISGFVIAEIMTYDGQTTVIETNPIELEYESNEVKALETKEQEQLDIVTIDVLLNTDIEYIKEKECVVLSKEMWRLNELEFNLMLDKLSQMENVKEIRVADELRSADERILKLTEEEENRLYEVIGSFKKLEVLSLNWLDYLNDLTPFKDMYNLRELKVNASNVTDLTPISGLTNLEILDLTSNKNLSDITPISNLTSLKQLNLAFNNILDLKPIENLTNLEKLSLFGNIKCEKYPALDSLKGLVNLKELLVYNFEQEDISFLENMHFLERLSLSDGNISDISVLENCHNLIILDLDNNNIEDISVLSRLTKLENVSLENNNIENIESLGNLKNLETLWIGHNNVKDITPLNGLNKIYSLYLEHNQITNIDVLFSMPNLKSVSLDENKIPDISLIEFLILNENINISSIFEGTDITAYQEAIEIKRELKNIDSLELSHLLKYDSSYLEDYDTVYLNEHLFNLSQEEFESVLEKLKQLPNLKNLRIMGPPCYPMYDIGIGALETEENISLLIDTIKQLQSLESLNISFVYLLNDSSFVYELPNLKSVNLEGNGLPSEELQKINEYISDIKRAYSK